MRLMSNYLNLLKDKKAAALMTVLILVFILTILATVMLTLLSNQTRIIEHNVARTKIRYADEAAMVRELDHARRNLGAFEQTHDVSGKYDKDTQKWRITVQNGTGPITGTTQLNLTSEDYGPKF